MTDALECEFEINRFCISIVLTDVTGVVTTGLFFANLPLSHGCSEILSFQGHVRGFRQYQAESPLVK